MTEETYETRTIWAPGVLITLVIVATSFAAGLVSGLVAAGVIR